MTRPYSETLAALEGPGIPRHYCRCKDCEFTEQLALSGWEDRSVWGLDHSGDSFFARLWRNDSRTGGPITSLPEDLRGYPWPQCLALDIIAVTRMAATAVLKALVLLEPTPWLRPIAELKPRLAYPPGVSREYQDGYRRALRWVLGSGETCPGSRSAWPGGRPSVQLVDAEYQLLDGRVYSQKLADIVDQQFSAGGQAALWWVLGRGDVLEPGEAAS